MEISESAWVSNWWRGFLINGFGLLIGGLGLLISVWRSASWRGGFLGFFFFFSWWFLWWPFLVIVVVGGGFWQFFVFLFPIGGCFLWLLLVASLVVMVVDGQ